MEKKGNETASVKEKRQSEQERGGKRKKTKTEGKKRKGREMERKKKKGSKLKKGRNGRERRRQGKERGRGTGPAADGGRAHAVALPKFPGGSFGFFWGISEPRSGALPAGRVAPAPTSAPGEGGVDFGEGARESPLTVEK